MVKNILTILILIMGIVGLIVAKENILLGSVLLGLVAFNLFIILIRNPEFSLAILFNGTLIYFYLIYKLGLGTSRLLTGSFYGCLAFFYILGGILIIAKKQKFRVDSIDMLFFSFFFWVFLSYFLFSKENELAYQKITYAPFLVIAPYIGIRLLSSEESIKKFFKYCVIIPTILIIPAFYELFFNPIFSEYSRFSIYMFEGGKDNPILFGITFAIMLTILFVWVLEQKKFKFKYFILMILSMFLLLRSGSRGAVISFLSAILFYIFITKRVKLQTKVYTIIFATLLFLSCYKLLPDSVKEFYQYTFTPEARSDEISSVYQRLTMWKMAINDFKENPVFGVGTGNSVEGIGFPHNILLEVAAELGIIGLFIFILLCYLTIWKAITFIKRNEKHSLDLNILMKLSLILFIYSLTEAMFSGLITNQTWLFMSIGLIVSLTKLRLNSQKNSLETKIL